MKFKTNGKLLISGEYFVLRGASALSIPTKSGQSMDVKPAGESLLIWESYDLNGRLWFSAEFSEGLSIQRTGDREKAEKLAALLSEAKTLNTGFEYSGNMVTTRLGFPLSWGLGSSSTLAHLIGSWAGINPVELRKTLGGSGYDIAQAGVDSPILYRLGNDGIPQFRTVNFSLPFSDELFFIYSGRKQSTSESLGLLSKKIESLDEGIIQQMDTISNEMATCGKLRDFEKLIVRHEDMVSSVLALPKISDSTFKDYRHGEIKSLGAWGGDFIMATGKKNGVQSYFHGLEIIPFGQMLL